ncbi:hypothetical protein [Photobacterium kishitanii]|uniref:DUF4136 domain-containing protein n=1 Tax=Photobacterium kishitanii TaxID=318456 RepID=A0A2T3KLD6_9GAMM|nr:hypothetical protein [Photobacterium kishitanii]PSV00501.1 hypothetical protein C9J27_05035 [Photobacterium kishitanii]
MKKITIIAATTVLMLQGCAANYRVQVDSLSDSAVSNKKIYVLLPKGKDVRPTDLRFREFSNYVRKALSQKGFVPANSAADANVVIFLDYAIGDPQTSQYTYSIPTWGQTGVSSSTTYGTLNTYGNTATYSGTTYNTPSYGITGSTTGVGTSTSYTRYVKLSAFDLDEYRKSGDFKQLWYTNAVSTGSSDDLRQAFPVMIAASSDYISGNTGGYKKVYISETDPKIQQLR